MPLIEFRDVVKEYPAPKRGADPIRAVDGVTLEIEEGSVTGIIGYSGAGKSTLVRLINALEPVSSGELIVDGTDITKLSERGLRKLRSGIGMVFQQFNLFSSRTVAGNIAYPLHLAKWPKAEREARVAELLEWVGLADKANAHPDQLSGGQKQRVGIARALATKPRILLADEATSALDPQTTSDVLELLKRANEELGITIIVITHEMDVVKRIATDVAVMENGRIVESGKVFDVFSKPAHPATARFVETIVEGVPHGDSLALLRERYPGHLATVSFRDGDVDQRDLFRRFGAARIDVELVAGGVQDIRGRSFGHLTFELQGEQDAIERTLREIAEVATVTDLGTGDAAAQGVAASNSAPLSGATVGVSTASNETTLREAGAQ